MIILLTAKRFFVGRLEVHLHQFSVSHRFGLESHPCAVFILASKTMARVVLFKGITLDSCELALGIDRFGEKLVAPDVIAA